MSRITYVKCDRCGKQFIPDAQHKVGWIGFNWRDPETDELTNHNPPEIESMEFCENCMADIAVFVKGLSVEMEAPPEVEIVVEEPPAVETPDEEPQKAVEPPEQKKAKKKPPKQKKLDVEKIVSLYTAKYPWDISKIADEMKCTENAVRYHLKKRGVYRGGDADDRNGEGQA